MKKLLFVLAFIFIGQQAFSQMYIVTLSKVDQILSGCDPSWEATLTITDPSGTPTYECISFNNYYSTSGLSKLNTELNDIINTPPGYKLVEMKVSDDGFMENDSYLTEGMVWFFAVP